MALHDPHVYPSSDPAADSTASEPLDTFGRYLLFERLERDGLGELYRAGQMGADAVERVVSLRLFNGGEVDGRQFLQACRARDGVGVILRGAAFGEAVDLGCEAGVAYVAHELVFGRSLAELLERARSSSQPVPLEQTLHIMDRVSIGLQNARQMRHEEKRILHGFLIPDFVHISSEGEIQLTGFELSPGLLELPASGVARGQLAGYISPEVNAGQPPTAADDVYSLGALFAELLTGEPLPALNPAESSRWVESAQLAAEGTPLPADVKHLLRESLLPREQRIQEAELWHQALVAITNASEYSPTTFDLAFLLNTLFGDELEREVWRVEVERQSELPAPSCPEPVPASPEPPVAAAAEIPDLADPSADERLSERLEEPAAESSEFTHPTGLEGTTHHARIESRVQAAPWAGFDRRIIAAAAAALAVAGLAIAYFALRPSSTEPAPDTLEVSATPPADSSLGPATTPAAGEDDSLPDITAVAPPLTPEEIEAQVRSLVAQRAGALEANLKAEYDQRLVELRTQLEAARAATSASTRASEPAAEPPAQPPAIPAEPEPGAMVVAASPPANEAASAEAAPTALREPVARTGELRPQAGKESSAQPAPTRAAATEVTAPPTQPQPKAVEPGSVVVQGPGVVPPKLTRRPRATYPPAAARLKREATVKLRVLVDETGRPTEVEQDGKAIGMGFDQSAITAAKTTRWTPPTKDGVPVKMWVELSIDFRP